MDKFSNMPESATDLYKEFGSSEGAGEVEQASSTGAMYGISRSDMEQGYEQTDYADAATGFTLPIGRVPTKRIDG
jgi:hypothetical protein